MDILTAIGLAISLVKVSIQVYELLEAHPDVPASVRDTARRMLAEHTAQLADLEDLRAQHSRPEGLSQAP